MTVALLFAIGVLIGLAPRARTHLARFNYAVAGIAGALTGGLAPVLAGGAPSVALRLIAGAAVAAACVIALASLRRLAGIASNRSPDQN